MERTYLILWPNHRRVSGQQLIVWARDDIANGESRLFESQDEVKTVEDAIEVLFDSGTVTLGNIDK